MSDPRHDFDSWLGDELRRPLPLGGSSRARIMARIRAEARGRAPRTTGAASVHAPSVRRGWVAGHAGGLLAAGVAGVLALGALEGFGAAGRPDAARPVAESAIRDTLRLVRFVLAAPTANSVALVGDFNGWRRDATPLTADRQGGWVAAVALPPGSHRYAFVVDDTQWVADPFSPAAVDSGRPVSALFVARAP